MIIRIDNINYYESFVNEFAKRLPVGTTSHESYAKCEVKLDDNSSIIYNLDLINLPELHKLIDTIKNKVKTNLGGLNVPVG